MADDAARVAEPLELTAAERRVLRALLENETAGRFQDDLVDAAAILGSGSIAVARLVRAGWLVKGVQGRGDVIPARKGSWFPPRFPVAEVTLPPRTWWKLTPDGARLARAALNR